MTRESARSASDARLHSIYRGHRDPLVLGKPTSIH